MNKIDRVEWAWFGERRRDVTSFFYLHPVKEMESNNGWVMLAPAFEGFALFPASCHLELCQIDGTNGTTRPGKPALDWCCCNQNSWMVRPELAR
jgi:hypothetical protein